MNSFQYNNNKILNFIKEIYGFYYFFSKSSRSEPNSHTKTKLNRLKSNLMVEKIKSNWFIIFFFWNLFGRFNLNFIQDQMKLNLLTSQRRTRVRKWNEEKRLWSIEKISSGGAHWTRKEVRRVTQVGQASKIGGPISMPVGKGEANLLSLSPSFTILFLSYILISHHPGITPPKKKKESIHITHFPPPF